MKLPRAWGRPNRNRVLQNAGYDVPLVISLVKGRYIHKSEEGAALHLFGMFQPREVCSVSRLYSRSPH